MGPADRRARPLHYTIMTASRSLLVLLLLVASLVAAHSSGSTRSTHQTHASSSARPFTAADYTHIFGHTWQDQRSIRRRERSTKKGMYREEEDTNSTYVQHHVTQRLDHFNNQNNETWPQTYYVNTQYWNQSITPPIVFLCVSGESYGDPTAILSDNIAYQAETFGALLVMLEHRFYGFSVPNNDSSTENMKYLSSQQALADLTTFHEHITELYDLGEDSQWITVGGSYGGALSAWARLKYPQLFVGAIASSAPIEAELDYYQFNEVVEQSLGPECSSQIAAAFQTVVQMLNTSSGQKQLQHDFNACGPFTCENDLRLFMNSLASSVQGTVQYAGNQGPDSGISTLCNTMSNSSATPYENFLQYSSPSNNGTYLCQNMNYTGYIEFMRSPWASNYRSWVYQTCNEFGFMITDDAQDEPFGHFLTLKYDEQMCQDIFGIENVQSNVKFTDAYYGGADIVTTNTFFVQGSFDPWHALGNKQVYTNGSSSQNVNVMINGTGHCADYEGPQKWDLPQLTAVRAEQLKMIAFWLSEDNATKEVAKTSAPVSTE